MMLSVGKIFWLIIILIAVWYLFKIIEKRKLNIDKNNQKKENDDILNTKNVTKKIVFWNIFIIRKQKSKQI